MCECEDVSGMRVSVKYYMNCATHTHTPLCIIDMSLKLMRLHKCTTDCRMYVCVCAFHSPLSGMVRRAAMALMAERFSSSCFSYSCFTELAFVFDCTVDRRGSISLSIPAKPVRQAK